MADPAQHAVPPGRPSPAVTVIVTNYNYGHFLGACLDSLSAQIQPAGQIIVVDDGSTDGSAAVLAGRADVEVISLGRNRGQAAAFNAGFAAARGDLLIFLDADDRLFPEAIRTIGLLWAGGLAGMAYDLDTIDAEGRAIGHYEMRAAPGDALPKLLRDLAVDFMPTSGNVVARAAIAWAFPLPERGWAICADALLARAALLSGPVRHLPQTLGSYRMHGQNGYYRDGLGQIGQTRRGNLDIARAGLDLAVMLTRPAAPPGLRHYRSDLILAAVRRRMIALQAGADRRGLAGFLGRALQVHLQGGGRIGPAVLLAAAALVLPVSGWLRNRVIDRDARPRGMQAVVRALAGPGPEGAMIAGRAIIAPLCDLPARLVPPELVRHCLGRTWHCRKDAAPVLCGRSGDILMHRLHDGPAWLGLDLQLAEDDGPQRVEVWLDGALTGVFDVTGREEIRMLVPGCEPVGVADERLTIRLRPVAPSLRRRLTAPLRPAGRLTLHALTFEAAPAPEAGMVLPVAASVPLSAHARAAMAGSGRPQTLVLAPPAPRELPMQLSILLSADQPAGWLDLHEGDAERFSGRIGPGSRILCDLPEATRSYETPVTLALWFRPDDPLAAPEVALARLGWQAGSGPFEEAAVLGFGAHLMPGDGTGLVALLADGWDRDEDGAPVFYGLSAGLRLVLPPRDAAVAARLRIDLAPLGPVSAGQALVIAAVVNGTARPPVLMAGEGTLDLALTDLPDPHRNLVEVRLHASVRGAGGAAEDGAGAALSPHSGVRLAAVSLDPAVGMAGAPDPLPHPAAPQTPFGQALDHAAEALGSGAPAERTTALADGIDAILSQLSDRGVLSLVTPAALETLAAIGARRSPHAAPAPPLPPAPAGAWLRHLARAMLAGPAHLTLPGGDLAQLPPCTEAYVLVLARWLVADARPGSPDEAARLQAWLVRLLDAARALIVAAPSGSPAQRLGLAVLENCRPSQMLFTDQDLRPLAEALGQAVEAHQLMRGHLLTLPPLARPGGPRRIVVLLRHDGEVPEIRILRALMASLPPNDARITLVFADCAVPQADLPGRPRLIGLADQPVGQAVDTIRALAADVVILGSFCFGFERLTLIAAHRLAPCQIALSAVWPITTGLASVDGMVIGSDTAPAGCEADYAETVTAVPGMGQSFAETGPARDPAPRDLTRQRLGIAGDAVLLVSGAMLDKIGDALLSAWVQILAAAPQTVLALYPFAANWHRSFDEAAFLDRISCACAAQGVGRNRLRVLAPLPRQGVADLLTAGDVYLDSFPYSGATTTVEALTTGLPVLALAGRTERGHQAAAWVTAFGAGEWVATTPADYVAKGVRLATDAALRATIARGLRRVGDAPLRQDGLGAALAGILGLGAPEVAPRYLFHHLPKAGGTSLQAIFRDWFTVCRDYREPWSDQRPAPLNLSGLPPDALLAGHFAADGMPLSRRYPETADPARWRKIAFLRDPLDLALSNWYFECAKRPLHDPSWRPKPLGEFLRGYPGIYTYHFECGRDSWREVLEGYWFIGTTERLPECVAWLAWTLGKPMPDSLPHENATRRGESPDPEDVAIFARNMAHEFEIYRWVSDRLRRTLGEQPLDQLGG